VEAVDDEECREMTGLIRRFVGPQQISEWSDISSEILGGPEASCILSVDPGS